MAEDNATMKRSPTAALEEMIDPKMRIEELSSTASAEEELESNDFEDMSDEEQRYEEGAEISATTSTTPLIYLLPALLQDELETQTSIAQDKVAELCRKIMSGEGEAIKSRNSHGVPALLREKHIQFLKEVFRTYPSAYEAMDASRPWMIYWALAGLAHLGVDVSQYRDRAIQSFTPMQNSVGGFGGGHGQSSHVAPSYAATLSLALVGGLEIVNRRTMWHFLGSLKQPDGGFTMAVGGEKDVRGAYCAMTIVNLLNLPLSLPRSSPANIKGDETFLTNLGEWIGRCQTYEGGIGGAPDNEAHGAYTFCGLACLCIIDAPHRSIPRYLNVPRLISWLSSRQSAPEAGFSGRTNKLVDACYSHWVGGCWAFVEVAVSNNAGNKANSNCASTLWNRAGLVRYTLCCSQVKNGGLRDKPGTRQDAYHSCYSLAGYSAAHTNWKYEEDTSATQNEADGVSPLTAAFNWKSFAAVESEGDDLPLDDKDTISAVHPVFVIPPEAVFRVKEQFEHAVGF